MSISKIISGEYAKHNLVPWLTPAATSFLESLIQPDWIVFEWGSGASSIWLARRCKQVVTVDHKPHWHKWLVETAAELRLTNLIMLYRSDKSRDYVRVIDRVEYPLFDMVLVDGRHRMSCIQKAHPRVRPKGLLLLDNSERRRYRIPSPVRYWPMKVVECDPEINVRWQAKFFFKPTLPIVTARKRRGGKGRGKGGYARAKKRARRQ